MPAQTTSLPRSPSTSTRSSRRASSQKERPILDRAREGSVGFAEVLRDQAALRAAKEAPSTVAKRALDIVGATLGLLVAAPLLFGITLAISLTGQRPIFVHHRLGVGGRIFPCLKFRTMYPDAEDRLVQLLANDDRAQREWDDDQKLTADPRVTPIGRVLRRTNLDELPQLVNVLLGHMSLVGPRPIVVSEVVRYGSRYPSVAVARPGLTGLWQISGRHRLTYERRVDLDLRYVKSRTMTGDLHIIAVTLWQSVLTLFGSDRFGGV